MEGATCHPYPTLPPPQKIYLLDSKMTNKWIILVIISKVLLNSSKQKDITNYTTNKHIKKKYTAHD